MGFCETLYPQLLLCRTPQVSKFYTHFCESLSKAGLNSSLQPLDSFNSEKGGLLINRGYVYDC